ncbi:hypothetical protein ABH917_003369 [Thermobifida halotolerans]
MSLSSARARRSRSARIPARNCRLCARMRCRSLPPQPAFVLPVAAQVLGELVPRLAHPPARLLDGGVHVRGLGVEQPHAGLVVGSLKTLLQVPAGLGDLFADRGALGLLPFVLRVDLGLQRRALRPDRPAQRPLLRADVLAHPAPLPAGGDTPVLGVVLDLVVALQLPTAVGHGQQERGHAQGDDDRGEDHRLRQRVGHLPGRGEAEQRRAARGAAGGQDHQVDPVAEQDHSQQDAGEAALQQQRHPGGHQNSDHGDQQDRGGVVHAATSSLSCSGVRPVRLAFSACSSIPAPRLYRMSWMRPTTSR